MFYNTPTCVTDFLDKHGIFYRFLGGKRDFFSFSEAFKLAVEPTCPPVQ
jgi:hypothetical protein